MIVLAALGVAAALLLIWAGTEHLRDPATLTRVLAGQGVRGVLAARSTARAVAAAELLVGTAVIVSLAFGVPDPRWALLTQGLLYLGFLASLLVRYQRGDRTDCGCGGLPAVVGPAGVARAGGLALVSLLAAVADPMVPALGGTWMLLLVTSAAVLTVLLRSLPPAIDGIAGSALQRGTAA